jgi:hypothetical protein
MRWILSASPTSCILYREPWPGMVGTYHGTERRLYARQWDSRDAAAAWAKAHAVSAKFVPEQLDGTAAAKRVEVTCPYGCEQFADDDSRCTECARTASDQKAVR